ncbi:MAG: hypothetical protein ACUVV0_11300 [Anaerolineae bacterium]
MPGTYCTNEGERRAAFLAKYLDLAPHEVLTERSCSLCLLKPHCIWGRFSLDSPYGKYEARLGFFLEGESSRYGSLEKGGLPVTDLKWRALGRLWLRKRGVRLDFDDQRLKERLNVKEIYLAVGLTRPYKGEYWPMVIGVHTVPDYEAPIDYNNL